MYGLKELTPDDRDFSLGGYDPLPALDELPDNFSLPFTVKDQTSTDFCSAFATCAASEVQEGVSLNPYYSFAAGKEISGDPNSWGNDLRSACKAHQKYGALSDVDTPVDKLKIPLNERRYWKNWKDVLPLALQHKKQSYFKITGQYSDADNIKAALYKYNTPIVIGIQFGYMLTDKFLEEPIDGYGHAMTVLGWTPTHFIVGNSYGDKAGDNGVHYVSAEVLNHWVPRYGAYTFIDEDPETVKYNARFRIFASDNWLVSLWKMLVGVLYLR